MKACNSTNKVGVVADMIPLTFSPASSVVEGISVTKEVIDVGPIWNFA